MPQKKKRPIINGKGTIIQINKQRLYQFHDIFMTALDILEEPAPPSKKVAILKQAFRDGLQNNWLFPQEDFPYEEVSPARSRRRGR